MPIKQELYIIRHGETEFNKQRIIQGRGVDTSLNETGKTQAHAFFEAHRHLSFDRIYSSELLRSIQTIEPFREQGYEIFQRHELNEIDWGNYEGLIPTDHMKSAYKDVVEKWRAGKMTAKIDGGESPVELQFRQKQFIHQELKHQQGRILICMHGRAMRVFLCTLLNQGLDQMDDYPHENLTLYLVKGAPGNYTVELSNHTAHLAKQA